MCIKRATHMFWWFNSKIEITFWLIQKSCSILSILTTVNSIRVNTRPQGECLWFLPNTKDAFHGDKEADCQAGYSHFKKRILPARCWHRSIQSPMLTYKPTNRYISLLPSRHHPNIQLSPITYTHLLTKVVIHIIYEPQTGRKVGPASETSHCH